MSNFSSPSKGPKHRHLPIRNQYSYSTHNQLQDLQYQTKIFSSENTQQYFNLLKRLHLSITNTPQLIKKKQYNSTIQIEFKIYNKIWISHLSLQSFQEKIRSIIVIIKAYIQLIKEYGLFNITVNHIRINIYQEQAIWIHHNFYQNYCSHPMLYSVQNQEKITLNFIYLVQDLFRNNLFKYKSIHNLTDLLAHLQFINKRNIIHKKCNFLAQEKKRSSLKLGSPERNKKDHFFYRSQGDVSTLIISNIIKYNPDDRKQLTKSNNFDSFKSKNLRSPGSFVKPHLQTKMTTNKNKSGLELSYLFNKSPTKISTNSFSPVVPYKDKYIKQSQYQTREDDFNKVLDNVYSNNKLSSGFQKQNNTQDEQENILQRDINNLLLSEIHQGEQNDMKPHPNYETQLLQEFHNILN